ncbi:DUF2812 domain-containing protein [Vagococcus fluvialis]|uniref:DUF2812 domain-containing protein n=1 Tax=Vagococcus fluvialis TaxID=2738 RepID=UPI003D0B800F
MIIKEKKYVISKGLAFYAEMESQRLEKELADGWLMDKINWLGFYRLKKVKPEEAQIVIDFYPGKKNEIDEYLDIYEAAGWEKVTSYRNRYFVFKSDVGTEEVYTDEESYASRLKKEKLWMILNSFYFFIFGLIGLLLIKLPNIKEWLLEVKPLYFILVMVTELSLMVPLIVTALMLYYKVIYAKRQTYYKEPKSYAKKQHFFIDLILAGLIGAFLGGIIGFLSGYFELF